MCAISTPEKVPALQGVVCGNLKKHNYLLFGTSDSLNIDMSNCPTECIQRKGQCDQILAVLIS